MQNTNLVAAVARRYADAYVVTRTVETFGTVLKFVAAGAASIIFAAGSIGVVFVMSAPGRLDAMRFVTAALVGASGTFLASAVGIALFVLGTLTAAQAQILSATVDTAVNSSKFINDEDRARIMSLPVAPPRTVVAATVGVEVPAQRIPVGA